MRNFKTCIYKLQVVMIILTEDHGAKADQKGKDELHFVEFSFRKT